MYVNEQALLSLIAGILILIRPALLNYIIAIYLIIVGVLGLVRWFSTISKKPMIFRIFIKTTNTSIRNLGSCESVD